MLKYFVRNWILCCALAAASSIRPAEADIRVDSTVEAIRKVMPSVVNISTKTVIKQRGYIFDWWKQNLAPYVRELPPQYSAGSGLIIDEEGYVLTNVHVVGDAQEIWVKLADDRLVQADALIGTTKSDVALLKLRGKPGEKFVAAHFAAADDLLLGEAVIALGNPFGLGASVSKGILSALPRRKGTQEGPLEMDDWLQTDAAINPGNSGGPLVDLRGDVVGLNVAIYREAQGIGFAIPIQRVGEALSEIFTPEEIKSLWFGARFHSVSNRLGVASVEAGSPAEKGGLRVGDFILKINHKAPKNLIELTREIMGQGDAHDAAFSLERQGEVKSASVRLVAEKTVFTSDYIRQKLGVSVQELTPALSERMGFAGLNGLLIASVDKGSPAEKARLEHGLLLEALDGQPLGDIARAAKAMGRIKPGGTAQLTVIIPRPPRRATVSVKLR